MSITKKVLFSVVAVVAILVLLEVVARLVVGVVPNAAWEVHRRGFSTRGFPALEEILVPDAELFWKLRPGLAKLSLHGQLGPSAPMRFAVSTDERGFRRTPQAAGVRRSILFLGDSCTFGLGVEDDETFPARVQTELGDVQTINAGVPGYSSYQGNVLLQQIGPELKPDVVVITFGINDQLQWDNRSDLEHAQMIAEQRGGWLNRSRFADLLRVVLPSREATEPTNPRPRLTDDEFEQQLRAMVRWCRAHDAEPVLMIWPTVAQMVEGGGSSKQEIAARVAGNEGVRLVDPVHAFRSHGGVTLFRDAVHANAAGCRRAAAVLSPVLSDALER
jgi:lysophospholipase L1-like esterase